MAPSSQSVEPPQNPGRFKNVELSQTVIDLLKQRLDSAAEQNPTAVAELLGLVAKINAKP
jgi:hypothetical protein